MDTNQYKCKCKLDGSRGEASISLHLHFLWNGLPFLHLFVHPPHPPHHAAPELVSRVQLHTVVTQTDRYMYYDQVSSSVCLNADLCFFLCRPVVSRSSTQLGYSLPSPDTQLGYSVLPSGRERFFIGPAFGGDLDDALLE